MGRCAGEIWTFNPWTLLWTASSLDWGGGWGTWSCPDLCPERTKVPARWTSGWIVNISAAQSMGPSSAFCPKALSLFSDSGEQLWTVDFVRSAGLPDVCWPQVFFPWRRPCRLWDQQGWGVCKFSGFPRAEGASLGRAGLWAGTQGRGCGTQSLTLCWLGLGSEEWWGKLEGIIPAPWIAWD